MIARPWEKDNYPIQEALCSYNHSIFLLSLTNWPLFSVTEQPRLTFGWHLAQFDNLFSASWS